MTKKQMKREIEKRNEAIVYLLEKCVELMGIIPVQPPFPPAPPIPRKPRPTKPKKKGGKK